MLKLSSTFRLFIVNVSLSLPLALSLLMFSGCNKPNANPELLDPIYSDIEKQIKEAEASVSTEEKSVGDFEEAMKAVKPQTGQIKYARKRLFDASQRLEKARQQLEYLKIHLNTRLREDQVNYLKAFNAGQPWPIQNEYAEYKEHARLNQIPLKWDVKSRIEATKPQEKHKKTEE